MAAAKSLLSININTESSGACSAAARIHIPGEKVTAAVPNAKAAANSHDGRLPPANRYTIRPIHSGSEAASCIIPAAKHPTAASSCNPLDFG